MLQVNERTRRAALWGFSVACGLAMAAGADALNAAPFLILVAVVLLTAVVSSRLGVLHPISFSGPDERGIYPESALAKEIDAEIYRSRRYHHEFAVVMISLQEQVLRFDYTREDRPALRMMTESLLTTTREKVDKVFRCSSDQFCLLLPETDAEAVMGLVRRMRRTSGAMAVQGENPPLVYGATFYPTRATMTDALIKRAHLAVAIARKAPNRVHLDGAEAGALPPVETMRRAS